MVTNTKFVQAKRALLQSSISSSATSCTVTEFLDLAGNAILSADIGTVAYGTFEPNTAREEAISFTITSNTAGTAVLALTRGLRGKYPYGTGGIAFAHEPGAELILSNNPDLFNKLTAKDNDEAVTGAWTFVDPVADQNPVTKIHLEDNAVFKTGIQTIAGKKTFTTSPKIPDSGAVDEALTKGESDTIEATNVKLTGNQSVAGVKTFSSSPVIPDATAANQPFTKGQHDADATASSAVASPTVRGSAKIDVVADDPLNPKALTATADRAGAMVGDGATPKATNPFVTRNRTMVAGATIAGATLPVPVYQSKTNNSFYACDANDTTAMKYLGMAITDGTATNPIDIQFTGIVSGFTGLAEGEKYYVQDVVGTIGTTIGTTEILVGVAISTTELLIQKGKREIAGSFLVGAVTTSIVITTGFRPSVIRLRGFNGATSFGTSQFSGVYTNGALTGGSIAISSVSVVESNSILRLYAQTNWPAWYMTFTVNSITDTGFTITYTKTNTYPQGGVVTWSAEGEI